MRSAFAIAMSPSLPSSFQCLVKWTKFGRKIRFYLKISEGIMFSIRYQNKSLFTVENNPAVHGNI